MEFVPLLVLPAEFPSSGRAKVWGTDGFWAFLSTSFQFKSTMYVRLLLPKVLLYISTGMFNYQLYSYVYVCSEFDKWCSLILPVIWYPIQSTYKMSYLLFPPNWHVRIYLHPNLQPEFCCFTIDNIHYYISVAYRGERFKHVYLYLLGKIDLRVNNNYYYYLSSEQTEKYERKINSRGGQRLNAK